MLDFNEVSNEDLYGMCNSGDESAWEYVYNYILIICEWNKWNLHDEPRIFAQEITVHLLDNALRKVKEKKKFRNFITVMSVNKIKDSFKSHKDHISIDEPVKNSAGENYIREYVDPSPRPDEIFMSLEIVKIIDGALSKLDTPRKEILREYFNYKLGIYKDYNELSMVLKMPIGTISSEVTKYMKDFIKIKEIKALRT